MKEVRPGRSTRANASLVCCWALMSLCLFALPACDSDSGGSGEGRAVEASSVVPWPDTSAAAPRVAEQIEQQRDRVESATALEASERAKVFGDAGLVLLTYEFFDAARACFYNAALLQPDHHRWHYLLGYLASMQGELERAATLFDRSLELEPNHQTAHLRLADVRRQLGEVEIAQEIYQRVLEQDPESARAHAGVGQIQASRGEQAAAIVSFEAALALEPRANSLHYALSQSHRALGQIDQAERHLALRGDIQVPVDDPLIDPIQSLGRSPELYLARAGQAMKNNRYDIAADSYQKALELAPEDPAIYRGLSFSSTSWVT